MNKIDENKNIKVIEEKIKQGDKTKIEEKSNEKKIEKQNIVKKLPVTGM